MTVCEEATFGKLTQNEAYNAIFCNISAFIDVSTREISWSIAVWIIMETGPISVICVNNSTYHTGQKLWRPKWNKARKKSWEVIMISCSAMTLAFVNID